MQQRRAGRFDAALQHRLDVIELVDAFGTPEVDDQMRAGVLLAVTQDEVIFALVRLSSDSFRTSGRNGHFLLGGA